MNRNSAEAKLITLVICAIRLGINRSSIISYLTNQVNLDDSHTQDTCFLRALEINELIEKQYGKDILPIALIAEMVKIETDVQKKTAIVVRLHAKSSPNETDLETIGIIVHVLDEAGEWTFVESDTGPSGWVPKHCLVESNTLDI